LAGNCATTGKITGSIPVEVFIDLILPASRCPLGRLGLFISNFHRVLKVVCFLLGNSPASEFYMPTFRNTLFHLHRQVGACRCTYLPMKMEQKECSETSEYKIQTPGNHTKERIQHYQGYYMGGKSGRCVGLTNLPPSRADFLDIGALKSCNPRGMSGTLQGLLYLLPLWQMYYSTHTL